MKFGSTLILWLNSEGRFLLQAEAWFDQFFVDNVRCISYQVQFFFFSSPHACPSPLLKLGCSQMLKLGCSQMQKLGSMSSYWRRGRGAWSGTGMQFAASAFWVCKISRYNFSMSKKLCGVWYLWSSQEKEALSSKEGSAKETVESTATEVTESAAQGSNIAGLNKVHFLFSLRIQWVNWAKTQALS